MNKIVHLGLFLAIVSAVAGGALAFANQMTAPVIAENNERQEKESLLAMYPDANSNDFKLVNKTLDSKTVQKVYEYKNVYIFNASANIFVGSSLEKCQNEQKRSLKNGNTFEIPKQSRHRSVWLPGLKAYRRVGFVSRSDIAGNCVSDNPHCDEGYLRDGRR